MNKSESIKEIAAAMAKFQADVKNPTNSASNPFFKSKYAPLNEILNDVRPLLAKYGLSVLQMPSGDDSEVHITTLLMHQSGEWIESCPLKMKPAKNDPQGIGSAITYGRRYALAAILGISSEDDDDGNVATHGKSEPASTQRPQAAPQQTERPKPAPAPTTGNKASDAQVKAIWAIGKKANVSEDYIKAEYGVESIKDLTKDQASQLITEMQKFVNDQAS